MYGGYYMSYVVVDKNWGKETWVVNNNLYCLKEFLIYKNEWTSNGLFHYHKLKDETFYVLEGVMCLESVHNGVVNELNLTPGASYNLEPYVGHRFTSLTDTCKAIEVSTQHFDSDSYRVTLDEFREMQKKR